MDKFQLRDQAIKHLLETEETARRSSQAARRASIEAPSKMQSRYDSTKSEQDWLSHALAITSTKTRAQIKQLQDIDLSSSTQVRLGSLVTLQDENRNNSEHYFVLPAGSGITLDSNESQRVVVVTPESPVGKAIIGKSIGDRGEVHAPRGIRYVRIQAVE